jgi:hypothetical protein
MVYKNFIKYAVCGLVIYSSTNLVGMQNIILSNSLVIAEKEERTERETVLFRTLIAAAWKNDVDALRNNLKEATDNCVKSVFEYSLKTNREFPIFELLFDEVKERKCIDSKKMEDVFYWVSLNNSNPSEFIARMLKEDVDIGTLSYCAMFYAKARNDVKTIELLKSARKEL